MAAAEGRQTAHRQLNLNHLNDNVREAGLRISTIAADSGTRWDNFVRDHPLGTICHTTAWRRAMEQAFPHVSGQFLALEDPRTLRIVAGLPVYSVKSWLRGDRLVSVPFAPWCDPLAESEEQLGRLLRVVKEREKRDSCKFTELRIRCSAGVLEDCGLVARGRWLHHYVALDRSRVDLWRNLSRTAVRRLIRSAEKSGVTVAREDTHEAMASFHQLLSHSRHRLGLPPIPIQFFQALQQHLGPGGQALLLARRSGSLCGGVLATKSRQTFHLDYSAVGPAQAPLGSMQLLYWRALKMAQEEGCAEFSFGRTGCDNAGLAAYKRHWGCVEEELREYRTHCASRSDARASTAAGGRMARTLIRCLPRPLYNLAGTFFYRHR